MARRRLTPQEKKHFALTRDVVHTAVKYPKTFRRNWPKKKARLERAYRHAWARALSVDENPDELALRREPHGKWAGPRLGEHIAHAIARRERLRAEPRKSEAARARRRRSD